VRETTRKSQIKYQNLTLEDLTWDITDLQFTVKVDRNNLRKPLMFEAVSLVTGQTPPPTYAPSLNQETELHLGPIVQGVDIDLSMTVHLCVSWQQNSSRTPSLW
jgi:hypothetical protein